MKTFRKLGKVFMCIIACFFITACGSDGDTPVVDGEKETYIVKLGWEGELDITYEPLSRTSTNDLYGIQVYSTPDNDGQGGSWTGYAYGLFDDPDNITIQLVKGYKYKLVATMVKNGKDKISNYDNKYSQPFCMSNWQGGTNNPTPLLCENKFNYSANLFFNELMYGESQFKDYQIYTLPNTERYYGELADYRPSEHNSKANIHMKRTSFGAKFIAKGKLANKGTLEIMIPGAPEMTLDLTQNNKTISDIYTFTNVKAAWESNGNYSETVLVSLNWHKDDGAVVPMGNHNITYKRNATTVVTVTIENDGEERQFGFEYKDGETGSMPEDSENSKEIVDGEIVDTNVGTNK